MKTRAAVLWDVGRDWVIEEVTLDPPAAGEVLVEVHAAGLCHSDEHIVTGDLPYPLPCVGGHEGAGVVTEVGPGVTSLVPGDHVVFSFVPSCGRCPSCSTGHQSLCDLGALLGIGLQLDGTARHHIGETDLHLMCMVGAFAEHTVVSEASCVKIEPDVPLDRACLLGCGVVTGWGSAVYAAQVIPGDVVAVVGVGGIGINAVQGAKAAGAKQIWAIDPVEFRRQQAVLVGATHTAVSIAEAQALIAEASWGRMADKVIMAIGVGDGALLEPALQLAAKRGRLVVTNLHPAVEEHAAVNLMALTLLEKQIVGSLFGSANPRADIPKMIELYKGGQLDLDTLVTNTYPLDDVNQGYVDMRAGLNVRGVLRLR